MVVTQLGTGSLSVTAVNATSTGNWLSVSEASVDANGIGSYDVVADTTGLTSGVYTGNISVIFSDSTSNDLSVTLDIGNTSATISTIVPTPSVSNYPALYALLQQTTNSGASFSTIEQVNASPGSTVSFDWSSITEGNGYRILYGSDIDNDGSIDDANELVGAYPNANDISETFSLNASLSDLDLPVFFNGRRGVYGSVSTSAVTSSVALLDKSVLEPEASSISAKSAGQD
jgi:hypothetical protein